MSVKPARDAFLECDGCHKEIHRGASTLSGRVMTFVRIDSGDNEPLFTGTRTDLRYFHIWCLDPKAAEPECYEGEE